MEGTGDVYSGEGETSSNVVHFPRDWIGPREELIPVASAPRAEDFWTGDSAALHDVLQGPREEAHRPGVQAAEDPAQGVRVGERTAWSKRRSAAARSARGRADRLAFHAAAFRLPGTAAGRTAPVVAVALLALICLTLAIANLATSGPAHLAQAAGPAPHASAFGARPARGVYQRIRATRPTGTREGVRTTRRRPAAGTAARPRGSLAAVEARRSGAATQPGTPVAYHGSPAVPPPSSPPSANDGSGGGSGASRPPTVGGGGSGGGTPPAFGQGGMLGPGHGNGTG